MRVARKYLDFAWDFLVFIAACFFILNGFSRMSMMQSFLHHGLTDKGVAVTEESPAVCYEGTELLAMLYYPEGIESIVLDGMVYTGNFEECISGISSGSEYKIQRKSSVEGKITLYISEIVW